MFFHLVKATYPWAEADFAYSISEEEKSDILDRISSEVRKAVAQAAEDTKIQLQNKEALAKNASWFRYSKLVEWCHKSCLF